MKVLKNFLSVVFVISLLLTSIISAVDVAVYADYGYFEDEYKKYNVNAEGTIVDMEMDELMSVTKDMMRYLRGQRSNLIVIAEVGGETVEFFNDIEKRHMADCRDLFVAAIWIRRVCLLLMIAIVINMVLLKMEVRRTLSKAVMIGIGVFTALLATIVGIVSIDFNSAFITFHHIFFSNSDWLLDERTDRLINIVPEGFFIDTAIRIVIFFLIIILCIFAMAFFLYRGKIKKSNNIPLAQDGGTHEQG